MVWVKSYNVLQEHHMFKKPYRWKVSCFKRSASA